MCKLFNEILSCEQFLNYFRLPLDKKFFIQLVVTFSSTKKKESYNDTKFSWKLEISNIGRVLSKRGPKFPRDQTTILATIAFSNTVDHDHAG